MVDVVTNQVYPACISVNGKFFGKIEKLEEDNFKPDIEGIVTPGFIDSHLHIESSMLTPAQFAKVAVRYGTTSAVCDPHEIANVCGMEGIDFMIENSKTVPFDFYFTAPSCVPSTIFETSGAQLDSKQIKSLVNIPEIVALGEMMNFPGVISGDEDILKKIDIFKRASKPIDGHAPMLTGEDLDKYISAGISTDHECSNFDEAIEKKNKGMKIMVREGSSAKNMEALFDFSKRIEYWKNKKSFGIMTNDSLEKVLELPIFDFIVSDDKHAGDLINGHLNNSIKKAVGLEIDVIQAIKMVTINPAKHYNLNSGVIAEGFLANFVVFNDLENLNVKETYINGEKVFDGENVLFDVCDVNFKNTMNASKKSPNDFDTYYNKNEASVNAIKCFNEELFTEKMKCKLKCIDGVIQSDIKKDILKIAVVERYGGNSIANGFINGVGLKKGAIATSIAHDSHNIIAVGINSEEIAKAVNLLIENEGGIAIVNKHYENSISLAIAGLMTNEDANEVASKINELEGIVKDWGSKMDSTFVTLSFMSLLVIPQLRLSDKGLFDVEKFEFIDLIND